MSGFSFGFSGDDIEDDGKAEILQVQQSQEAQDDLPSVPVQQHNVSELLTALPSRLAYSLTTVTCPHADRKTTIPRRALFDVKMQLMAESDGDGSQTGLGASDIEKHVYEGGFKSWEGALDLARLLLERGPRRDIDELSRVNAIVELGCGQALPSLVLWQHSLRLESSKRFVLADYNESVLRLVTLPNLLLVWAMERASELFNEDNKHQAQGSTDGDLEITDELKQRFQQDLESLGMELQLLSGPWSEQLVRRIPLHTDMSILVLAAETIYSPSSLTAFSDTLFTILRQAKMSKGIIASKRVYFGVGGGVDEFKERAARGGAVAYEVENSGIEGCDGSIGSGVGRCLLEVQMS